MARAFEKAVADALWPLGYRERRRGLLTAAVSRDVLAWLGLNRALLADGGVEVNPVVGVRHQRVERIVAELCGDKWRPFAPATVSISIGYLLENPRYRYWSPTPQTTLTDAAELASEVERVGLRLARDSATLETLARILRDERFAMLGAENFRLPVVLVLLGKTQEANGVVDDVLAKVGGADHAAAVRYRNFAAAFREWVRTTDGHRDTSS